VGSPLPYNRGVPPTQRPRLLGLDLDGTVIDSTNAIHPPTRDALHACHEAGIGLCFLTGRRPLTAGPLLDGIGLPAFVATNSGCLRWEYPAWRQIGRRMFPAALVGRIVELTAPYSVNFYLDGSKTGIEFIQLERESTPETTQHLARFPGERRIVRKVTDLAGLEVTQVALPAAPEITKQLRDRVQAELDGAVLALSVRWPLMPTMALEVFHPLATKGDALRSFAERLRIPQGAVVAVGDDVNDLSMLEWAGWSAAMPHSLAEVQAAADEVLDCPGRADGSPDDPAHALTPFLMRLLALPC